MVLPQLHAQDITLLTYFKANLQPVVGFHFVDGDGTLKQFLDNLNRLLSEHTFDVIHTHSPHTALFVVWDALRYQRNSLQHTVLTIHNSYPNFKLRHRLMFLPALLLFRRIIYCSQTAKDSFPMPIQRFIGERARLATNGVAVSAFDNALEQPPPAKDIDFLLVSASRLVPIKNLQTAIQAFSQSELSHNPKAQYQLMGAGEMRLKLELLSQELGQGEQVRFSGLLDRRDVYRTFATSDLFISPSLGEGMPIAVLEAMACRVPILISDIPPHREIVQHHPDIWLIHPRDVSGFAEAINRYSRMSVTERQALGQLGRRIVQERFSLDSMLAHYERIYREL